ncbi:MAG: MotA/TolQ/ExbB proton channel family protein [Vicinamibacterales bacterium]
MNLLGILENGLFALGQVLRLPVIVLLWASVASVLFLSGDCLLEFVMRRRERIGFSVTAWLREGGVLGASSDRRQQLPGVLRTLLADVERRQSERMLTNGGLEHVVLAHEERIRGRLTMPRLLVKVGPSLGLLGTLIPMGASLASLASGNLEAMAGQMVVAFTTTIVGLAVGTLAYVVATVRQHWVVEIVREERYLAERVASEMESGAV